MSTVNLESGLLNINF